MAQLKILSPLSGQVWPHGAKVQVIASGPDAKAAVEKLAAMLAQGCGDEGCKPAPAPALAHAIWEREGRPEGHDIEHWLLAEAQIRQNPRPTV